MSDFKERLKPNTTAKIISSCIPNVLINPIALSKMQLYVDICDKEIGWLGVAIKKDKDIIIQDVYLFNQEVATTTTEITEEGLSIFAEEILSQTNGTAIWNDLKVWGHSHVNMGVSPSSQDDSQMEFFANSGHDWFVRIIANKSKEFKVDVYDYESGIAYQDVPWERLISVEEEKIYNEINLLYSKVEELKNKYIDMFKEDVEKEIKEKVKNKSYYSSNLKHFPSTSTTLDDDYYASYCGYYNGNYNNYGKKKLNNNARLIHSFDDVISYFTDEEIFDIAEMHIKEELEESLQDTIYENCFSSGDLSNILKFSKEYVKQFIMEEVEKSD